MTHVELPDVHRSIAGSTQVIGKGPLVVVEETAILHWFELAIRRLAALG